MNQLNLMQQILQFQKTTADNGFRSANLLIEHGERLGFSWLDRFSLLPGMTRETVAFWRDISRSSRSACQLTVHAFFEPFEQIYTS